MRRRRIVIFLLAFTLAGCGPEVSEPQASPTTGVETPKAQKPEGRPSPTESYHSGSGGSSGSGGGTSVIDPGSSASSTGGGGNSIDSTEKSEVAVSPAEWRRKNYKPRAFSEFKNLRGYAEVSRLVPQPPSPSRVDSGKRLYKQACVACHNTDGSPVKRDPALMKYNMADLSQPQQYLYGSSPKAIYRSIRYGVPSPPMGFTGEIYSKTQVWDIVNYIQSIQKT